MPPFQFQPGDIVEPAHDYKGDAERKPYTVIEVDYGAWDDNTDEWRTVPQIKLTAIGWQVASAFTLVRRNHQ